jgi:hypothetical protein
MKSVTINSLFTIFLSLALITTALSSQKNLPFNEVKAQSESNKSAMKVLGLNASTTLQAPVDEPTLTPFNQSSDVNISNYGYDPDCDLDPLPAKCLPIDDSNGTGPCIANSTKVFESLNC